MSSVDHKKKKEEEIKINVNKRKKEFFFKIHVRVTQEVTNTVAVHYDAVCSQRVSLAT